MTLEERNALKAELLEEIQAKKRAVRAKWREHNREKIRIYDRQYYAKRRAAREAGKDDD